jgi:hypothetical protein
MERRGLGRVPFDPLGGDFIVFWPTLTVLSPCRTNHGFFRPLDDNSLGSHNIYQTNSHPTNDADRLLLFAAAPLFFGCFTLDCCP